MPDFENIRSRQYRPDPEKCCEKCCFGTGFHAEFCDALPTGKPIQENGYLWFEYSPEDVDRFTRLTGKTFKVDFRSPEATNLRDAMGSDL